MSEMLDRGRGRGRMSGAAREKSFAVGSEASEASEASESSLPQPIPIFSSAPDRRFLQVYLPIASHTHCSVNTRINPWPK